VPDPTELIAQDQSNAMARNIQIYKEPNINQPAFIDLIRAVVTNNRAEGWRSLRKPA
jgi:hypothetical protein